MSERLIAISDHKLSEKTIVLPEKLYNEVVNNKDNFVIVRYPFRLNDKLIKLSSLNILSFNKSYCEISTDIMIDLGLDINVDTLYIERADKYENNPS